MSALERLIGHLRPLGSAVLALSGGLDSSVLLAAAKRAGLKLLAATATGPTHPPWDLKAALELVRTLGVPHRLLQTAELQDSRYSSNPPDRCYWCKRHLFEALRALAQKEGLSWVLEGSNTDDLADYRPGLRAARELAVRSPFIEVGLGKKDIRAMAWQLGLRPRPPSPCLASRFPYGEAITLKGLQQVLKAETALREMGFSDLRVRHHGALARLEVPQQELSRALAMREDILRLLREAGYRLVCLDLEGLRSGSLNRLLQDAPRP